MEDVKENEYIKLILSKLTELQDENTNLKIDLASANAKLEVYERIMNISNKKFQLGFKPADEKNY